MLMVLKDKIAIITGAGRGLGRAFALRFAEEGAKLLLPDISLERAQTTAKEIKVGYRVRELLSSRRHTGARQLLRQG